MADISTVTVGSTSYDIKAKKVLSIQLTSENLNDIKPDETTFYYAGGSNSVTNTPLTSGQAFGMYVYRNASGYRCQELYGQDGSKWSRFWNASSWSTWEKYYGTLHKPTPADIGAAASSHSHSYLPLSGGTMTGTLTALGNQYTDGYTGALNMNNSNIYGLNSIYTADTSDNASEGIHFYRDATHVDTLWMNSGQLLFVPNRAIGTDTSVANSYKIYHTGNKPTYSDVGAAAANHSHSYIPLSGSSAITGSLVTTVSGECGFECDNTAAPHKVAFIVGSSGKGGMYDRTKSKWIMYSDTNGNGYLDGNATTATTATNLSGFQKTTTTNIGIDTSDTNQAIGYVSGLTKAAWNNQQTDGALYKQSYSASWIHQIFGDYRTGQLAVRGKNNGTWKDWRIVLDSANYTSYAADRTAITGISRSGTTFTATRANGTTFTFTQQDNNTDTLVNQSASTTSNWRKVLLHYKDDSASDADVTNSTNVVYACKNIAVQPSTGTLKAAAFSGPLTGNVTGNVSGSSGSCTGNSATATKATQDASGNTITSSYLRRYDWTNNSTSYNVDNLIDGMTFVYTSHSAPTVGTMVAFNCRNQTGYPFQLQGGYSDNTLRFRSKNGDNNTWNSWKQVAFTDSNITGSAGSVAWANVTGKPSTFSPATHSHDYLPLSGGTVTGTIISHDTTGRDVLQIGSANKDTNIWRVYDKDSGYAATGRYGFNLKYLGSGSGDNNSLALYADNQGASTQNTVWTCTQAGVMTFAQNVNISGTLTLTKTQDAAGTANNGPALIVGGAATSAHIEIDANEIMAKATGTTTAALYLNNDGGDVLVNGTSVRNASILNAGTLALARIPTGTTSSTVALGNHSHSNYYDANASRTANTVLAAPNGSAGTASFRALVATDLPVVTAEKGGSGKTSLGDSANAYINALSTGSSTPVDADYYVSQYVGGGTSTTSYHRRPMSALWAYIKGKADSTYQAKGSYAAASHGHGVNTTTVNSTSASVASGTTKLVITTTAVTVATSVKNS